MTIYTRFACPCVILADHGAHTIPSARRRDEPIEIHLVTVELLDEAGQAPTHELERCRFYIAESLRADDGWREIDKARRHAERLPLAPLLLKKALIQAR